MELNRQLALAGNIRFIALISLFLQNLLLIETKYSLQKGAKAINAQERKKGGADKDKGDLNSDEDKR